MCVCVCVCIRMHIHTPYTRSVEHRRSFILYLMPHILKDRTCAIVIISLDHTHFKCEQPYCTCAPHGHVWVHHESKRRTARVWEHSVWHKADSVLQSRLIPCFISFSGNMNTSLAKCMHAVKVLVEARVCLYARCIIFFKRIDLTLTRGLQHRDSVCTYTVRNSLLMQSVLWGMEKNHADTATADNQITFIFDHPAKNWI